MRYSPTDLEKKQLTSLWNGSCDRNSMWLRVAQVDGQQESRNLSSTTARNEILLGKIEGNKKGERPNMRHTDYMKEVIGIILQELSTAVEDRTL